jgi:NitT/TauT family transport system substrate-binding protein
MKRRGLIFVLLFAMVSFLLSACGSSSTTSGTSNGETIRIGYFPNLDHAPAIIGIKKGIFANELKGVNVQTQIFPDGNAFMDALSSGNIDLGYVGPGPVITRFMQGNDVVILSSVANGGTTVVARKDAGINSVKDLGGKSFASPGIGCTHDVQLEQMMSEIGLKSNRIGGTVNHQKQNPANVLGLFEQKQLDAAALPEPWGTYLVEKGEAKVIADWDQVAWGKALPSVVLVSTKAFVKKHPDLVKEALKAHVKSLDFVQKNKQESLKIINDSLYELTQKRLPENVLGKSWDRLKFSTDVDTSTLQQWADASYKLKFIKKKPNLDGLVDTSFVKEVSK